MADPIVLGITIRADGSAEVRRELGHVRDDLNGAGHAAQGVNRQFADMASMVKNLASAYISFDLAKSFVKNVEQVQNMKVQLIGLTNGAQDYANVENYLSELSQRHHKDNLALSDSFSKLLAIEQAGLITRQQSRALLEGMSNMQSKTGASADQMTQSMFGLSQALGAGILHMEELNQVTEPVPGLLNEIAKAAGFTGESAVGDFRAMVADGKITSDMFGNIMVNALSRYQGAAEAAGNTLTAQYADIKNAWTGLVKDLQEPVNDVLTPILKFARDQLDGIAQDIREIKALAADFKAIEANGMRPPGYVKPAKTSAASSAGQVKSTANAASIKRLIEESEGWYSEVVIDEERKRYQALDEAKKRSAALAKQQAEDAIRDAKRKSEAVAKGVSDEMAALKDHYNQLTMTARAYYETTLYAKGFSQAQVEAQLKEWDKVKAKEKEKELDEKYRSEMDAQIDKYKQLTLSAKEYYAEKLKAAGLNPEQIKSTLSVFGTNTEIEAAKKQTDDARSALDEYANSLNSVKKEMSGLGSVSSAVFDGALGGVNALTGAFSNMVSALQENTQALSTLREKQSMNELDKENKNYQKNVISFEKEAARLKQENLNASIDGIMQIAGASSKMFDQNSEEAKAMNLVVLGGLAAKAAAAMLTQGTGDPYTAFARIAAMGSLVAGIMSAAGAGGFDFSGGGSASAPVGSSGIGTVLGDSEAKSASVNNTYELLQDIHAKEYATLRSIDQGIYNLQSGITDVITRLFQAGGINVPTIDGQAKYAVDMQALNLTIGGPLGHMVEFAKKLPVIGGLISGIEDFVIGGLFGKTTRSVTGSGIGSNPTSLMDIMNGGDIAGYQYATIETKKKSWFSTKKSYSEQQMALDEATQDALTRVFKGMGQTMYGLAEQLGHDTKQKVEAYIIPALKVELHGLSGEDAAKKLNDVISASLDTMSDAVFGEILGQYQQLGEGMLETTTRIVSEIAIVQDALHQSGVSLTGDVVAISDAIVQAAGGLKEFQDAFERAFDKFATDEEKQKRLVERLQGQLQELFPQSAINKLAIGREEYAKLAGSLDQTNPLYADQYALLVKLAEAADQYYTRNEELRQSLIDLDKTFASFAKNLQSVRGSIGANIVGLGGTASTVGPDWQQRVIDNLYKQLAASSDNAEKVSIISEINSAIMNRYNAELEMLGKVDDAVKRIRDYLNSLKLGDKSPLTNSQKLAESQSQFSTQLAMAKAGDKDALAGITGIADAYLQQARAYYASSDTYTGIFSRVTSTLEQLAIPKGMDEATYKVESIKLQDKALSELKALDNTLLDIYAKEQTATAVRHMELLSALGGANNMDVKSALADAAMALGRQLTAFEAQWIKDQFASGRDKAAIYAEAGQYIKLHGSHADGLDYVPFDGYRAELHKGERVLTAAQARRQDGENDPELIAELRALRAEVAQLRAEQRDQTGALVQSYYDANDRASDKIVKGSKEAAKDSAWANRSKAVIA